MTILREGTHVELRCARRRRRSRGQVITTLRQAARHAGDGSPTHDGDAESLRQLPNEPMLFAAMTAPTISVWNVETMEAAIPVATMVGAITLCGCRSRARHW